MESPAEDILREILLKLPTRDAARCRCISKQWCSLLTDPSFIEVHVHAAHIVSGPAEALLVSQRRPAGMTVETTLYSVFSAKPMCSITDLEEGYQPINACNCFLFLALRGKECPLFVCNPITGEKLKIPAPPNIMSTCFHTYAMGFSPSTRQYKLFHLSARNITSWNDAWESYLEVYTLGNDGGGWRRNPHMVPHRAVYGLHMQPPPALVDGKLYMVTERPWTGDRTPDRMLVIDVASEKHYAYPLPEEFKGVVRAAVHPFDMCGQLCVALRFLGQRFLLFWVMLPPQGRRRLKDTKVGMVHCSWKRRYTFYVDDNGSSDNDLRSSSAWFDAPDGILCYRLGDRLYKYEIAKDPEQLKEEDHSGLSKWDHMIPVTPAQSADNPWSNDDQWWNVYGGYRPSLLSAHHPEFRTNNFSDDQEHYGHALLHALRCKQSPKKRCPTCPPHGDNHHPVRFAGWC